MQLMKKFIQNTFSQICLLLKEVTVQVISQVLLKYPFTNMSSVKISYCETNKQVHWQYLLKNMSFVKRSYNENNK